MILKLAEPILHQTQPTPTSCTATCIAMALGIPVEEMGVDLNRSHDFPDFGVWLAERGIWLRICDRGEPFRNNRVYLVGVRSLNVVNSDHAVLLDTRGPRKQGPNYNERSGWVTYDPNKGRDGKKCYDWTDENIVVDFCELKQHNPQHDRAGAPPA